MKMRISEKLRKLKLENFVACAALAVATVMSNGSCVFIFHQEKLPEEIKLLKKRQD